MATISMRLTTIIAAAAFCLAFTASSLAETDKEKRDAEQQKNTQKDDGKNEQGLTKEDRDDADRTFGVNDFKERDKNKNDTLELKEYTADIEEADRRDKREKLFHKVDLNKDGHVTREEVRGALGQATENGVGKEDAKDIDRTMGVNDFKERDANKDGELSMKEYIADVEDPDRVKHREKLFREADADKNGKVTRDEFRAALGKQDAEAEAAGDLDKEGKGELDKIEGERERELATAKAEYDRELAQAKKENKPEKAATKAAEARARYEQKIDEIDARYDEKRTAAFEKADKRHGPPPGKGYNREDHPGQGKAKGRDKDKDDEDDD